MANRNSEFGDIMPISGNLSHEGRMAALRAFGDGAKLMSNPDGSSYLQLTDEQREGENAHNDPRKPRIHSTEKKKGAEKLHNRGNKTGNVVREETHQRAHVFKQTIEHIAAVIVTNAHPISAQ